MRRVPVTVQVVSHLPMLMLGRCFRPGRQGGVTAFGKGTKRSFGSPSPKEVTDNFSLKGFGQASIKGCPAKPSDFSESHRVLFFVAKSALFNSALKVVWPTGGAMLSPIADSGSDTDNRLTSASVSSSCGPTPTIRYVTDFAWDPIAKPADEIGGALRGARKQPWSRMSCRRTCKWLFRFQMPTARGGERAHIRDAPCAFCRSAQHRLAGLP